LRRELPAALEQLIVRLLSKTPQERPSSAHEVAEALRTIEAAEKRTVPPWLAWLAVGLAAAVLGGVLALLFLRLPPAKQGPLLGTLKVFVWSTEAGKKGWEVRQPGALPVRNKEHIQLAVTLNRPAHVYLLWIDSEGELTPLYPWNQGNKLKVTDPATRPPEVPARKTLLSPPGETNGWTMGGPSGLETVVLLARSTPLPREVNLAEKIGKQKRVELRNPQEVAERGFEGGAVVGREGLPPDQFRRLEREAKPLDDALVDLMARLKDDFELIRLVQFAHEGR
jgi:hypothetical protein